MITLNTSKRADLYNCTATFFG